MEYLLEKKHLNKIQFKDLKSSIYLKIIFLCKLENKYFFEFILILKFILIFFLYIIFIKI